MLIGINPLLRGEVLAALDRMGHGDLLAIVDANFPARRLGSETIIDLPGADSPSVARAVFTLFPIDEAEPVTIMSSPGGRREVQNELLEAAGDPEVARVDEVDRHEFYALAEAAPVVIQTGELRGFANLLVRKGGLAR